MEPKKSGFHYLGIGCLIGGAVLVLATTVCGFVVYRWGKGLEADLRDPGSRRARVLEILRGDELPEGYHAMVAVRIPLLLETAILTDREAISEDEPPELGERGLIYFAIRDFGGDRRDLDAFFAGELADPEVLERHHVDVDLGERVAQGEVERSPHPIRWVTHHGNVSSDQARGRHEGLITLLQVRCGDEGYNRIGLWFGPQPEGDDPAGSVADPDAVARFVGHFRFCPEQAPSSRGGG
jgi:hypothetical protein